MTSTAKAQPGLRACFLKEVVPLAARLKGNGVEFLATRLDKEASSYYIARDRRSMSRADFEWGGCSSIEALPTQLAELWNSRGPKELAALAPAFGKFATALYTEDDEDDEVSPFIYAMY